MSEKSCTLRQFALFCVFLQSVVFYGAGRGGPRIPTRPIIRGIQNAIFWWFLMSEKSCTLTRFAVLLVFWQRVVFLCGRKFGSADSHPAHNSKDINCYFLIIFNVWKKLYFLMIFNVQKSCTLTRFAVFRVLWQRVVFLSGGKRGSADSHPPHNSTDRKCYFLMIFHVEKKLYFKVIRAISCSFTKGWFFMG